MKCLICLFEHYLHLKEVCGRGSGVVGRPDIKGSETGLSSFFTFLTTRPSEQVMWWLALVLFLICLGLLLYLDAQKPNNFPPGPPWKPILGSAIEIVQQRKKCKGYLYLTCADMAMKYGPLVGLRVGKDRQVILHSYEAIKEMLTKDEFDGRPLGPFFESRTWGVRRGILLTDEMLWQEQRRFVVKHLKEYGLGRRRMAELLEAESEQLLSEFKKKIAGYEFTGKAMDMTNLFGVHVLNSLWMMMASVRYSPEDKELKKLQALLAELFANIDLCGALFSQFPFLRYVAPEMSGYKQFINIHKLMWEFFKAELDRHKETFQKGDPRDLMDVYLEILTTIDKSSTFSEKQLLAICLDLFIAGSETTSKSLGFAFLYLLLYPEVQSKAREDIDRVVGRGRLPTLNDRPNLPYVEAIGYEAVRLFTGRAFGIPHRALKDTTLQGYNIPKDTMVISNQYAIHMDEQLWENPEVFRPERFIDSKGKIVVPDHYLPFGFGKRRCLGETLAKSNIFLFITVLLQNFEFTIPPGDGPPDTMGIEGATPSPKPYRALVTLRH